MKRLDITDADLCAEIELIPELNQKPAPEIIEVPERSDNEIEGADPPLTCKLNEIGELLGGGEEEQYSESNLIKCKVCYAEEEVSEMYNCELWKDHAVCKTCIGRFVSEQLHGKDSLSFRCIGDADCDCEYPLALLDEALSDDLKRQVTE